MTARVSRPCIRSTLRRLYRKKLGKCLSPFIVQFLTIGGATHLSVPLGHGEIPLLVHLPSLTLSRGHFYLAQRGHYHVAATLILRLVVRRVTSRVYYVFCYDTLYPAAVFKDDCSGRGGLAFRVGSRRRTRQLDLSFQHEPVPAAVGTFAQAKTASLEASRLRDRLLPWGDAGR